jgi:hypothetical protein
MVPAVLAATLTPSISNAEVHKCRGEVATIVGTPGDDILYGTNYGTNYSGDVIAGLGGNDTIYAWGPGGGLVYDEGHRDVICGHGGSDTIYKDCGWDCDSSAFGGRGADRIENGREDMSSVEGGQGDDTLVAFRGDSWRATVSYSSASGPITADLSTGVVTGEGTDTAYRL